MNHNTVFFRRLVILTSLLSLATVGIARETHAEKTPRPNILLIVADDLGFSDPGCYGGEIETPNLDRLAGGGLRLTQFYTTGRCCPSRASLLTGYYPHRVGLGHMTKDIGRPGYRGRVAGNVRTIAELLSDRGYRSFLSGKWHLGTEDPTKHGFEEFFGTLTSAKTHWDADHFLRLPKDRTARRYEEGAFYSSDALTDYAIEFLKQARQTPERPWFLYLAFNAPHFPLHAPKETIAKYTSRYKAGWDDLRKQRLARMKELGVVPGDTNLSARSPYYDWGESQGAANPAWESLPEVRRADLAQRMAIYAAMIDRLDQNIGRVVEDLKRRGEFESTLIIFTSDNGACAEWDAFGFDIKSGPENVLHHGSELEQMGSPKTYHSVGSGWANASNTPWRLYKHFNHEGGIAVPCILHWPAGMTRKAGDIDQTPMHLIDIAPTLLNVAAKGAKSRAQTPKLPGESLIPMLHGESLAQRTLFFEHEGNRAVRRGKWKLVSLRDKPWELYDLSNDRIESHDKSAKNAEIVKQLDEAWRQWAEENQVTPLPRDYGVEYLPVTDHRPELSDIFVARGYSLKNVEIPGDADPFPTKRLAAVRFESLARFDWFPEGPGYRPPDDNYFFSGNQALTRIDASGKLLNVLGQPGGGGVHFLPDGSVLIVGHTGLRRLFPDGRVALLADGAETGAGNDLTVGVHNEIYFSVPKSGVYRLTAGENGRLVKVCDQGCNGLDVDPQGKFLYVVRRNIQRYRIDVHSSTLGEPETVFEFAQGEGGGDGCAFDAWGNFYCMHFRTGVVRVVDPVKKKLLGKIPVGVTPASNLTFGGADNNELFVTAGSPKHENCQVLKTKLGITGFCGHAGATNYRSIRILKERGDANAFRGNAK